MSDPENKSSEFLNPKSMLTPGACGAVVMGITNTLAASLGLHGSSRMLLCLGLSFLIGTLVFAAGIKQLWQKVVYYIFNSLIIFTMGAGVNSASQTAFNPSSTNPDNPSAASVPASSSTAPPTNIHPLPPRFTNSVPVVSTNRPNLKAIKPRSQFFEHWH